MMVVLVVDVKQRHRVLNNGLLSCVCLSNQQKTLAVWAMGDQYSNLQLKLTLSLEGSDGDKQQINSPTSCGRHIFCFVRTLECWMLKSDGQQEIEI